MTEEEHIAMAQLSGRIRAQDLLIEHLFYTLLRSGVLPANAFRDVMDEHILLHEELAPDTVKGIQQTACRHRLIDFWTALETTNPALLGTSGSPKPPAK